MTPVSGSTSTIAACAPLEYVDCGTDTNADDSRPGSMPAGSANPGRGDAAIVAISPSVSPRPGAPRTPTRPSSSTRSSGAASSCDAATVSAFVLTSSAAFIADVPARTATRLANVPTPNGMPAVSPGTTLTWS